MHFYPSRFLEKFILYLVRAAERREVGCADAGAGGEKKDMDEERLDEVLEDRLDEVYAGTPYEKMNGWSGTG